MGTAGQQVLSGMMQAGSSQNSYSLVNQVKELEEDIADTRKELNFCKKEVQILNSERETVAEMSQTKSNEIDKYLQKEIHYLEELINKSQTK